MPPAPPLKKFILNGEPGFGRGQELEEAWQAYRAGERTAADVIQTYDAAAQADEAYAQALEYYASDPYVAQADAALLPDVMEIAEVPLEVVEALDVAYAAGAEFVPFEYASALDIAYGAAPEAAAAVPFGTFGAEAAYAAELSVAYGGAEAGAASLLGPAAVVVGPFVVGSFLHSLFRRGGLFGGAVEPPQIYDVRTIDPAAVTLSYAEIVARLPEGVYVGELPLQRFSAAEREYIAPRLYEVELGNAQAWRDHIARFVRAGQFFTSEVPVLSSGPSLESLHAEWLQLISQKLIASVGGTGTPSVEAGLLVPMMVGPSWEPAPVVMLDPMFGAVAIGRVGDEAVQMVPLTEEGVKALLDFGSGA